MHLEIKKLESMVLKAIEQRINVELQIPISLYDVRLEEKSPGFYTGSIALSEPSHAWREPLSVKIENGIATVNYSEGPFAFKV